MTYKDFIKGLDEKERVRVGYWLICFSLLMGISKERLDKMLDENMEGGHFNDAC